MGNKKKLTCDNCLNLVVSWNKDNVKIFDCGVLLNDDRKKKLSKKKRKKVQRALLKFIKMGFVKHCPCFKLWPRKGEGFVKESIGQKAKDFIKGRVE